MAIELPLLPRPRLGLLLQVAAAVAAVAIVTGTVVGWRVLGTVEEVAEQGAEVSLAALDAVDASLETAEELLTAARTALVGTVQTLRTVERSFDDAADALESVGSLTDTAAPALESARETLQTLEGVARTIDSTLRTLSRLPFGPDYDPQRGFGATVGRLADELAPLPAALRSTATRLDELVTDSADLQDDLASLTTALDDVVAGLGNSDELLAEYRVAAASARALATDTDTGLGIDLIVGRVALLLGGMGLAAGQAVPFLWGSGMRRPV